MGGCGCDCVSEGVCVWDSLDCSRKVCVCVCGKVMGVKDEGVCVGVTVWVWM